MAQTQSQKTLYQQDLVAWCDDTVTKLKAGQFEDIDIENLIAEIAALAGQDRRELKNRLEVLLNHLLKRIYVDSHDDYRGWEVTVREQRRQLESLLDQSPSLRNDWIAVFPDAWKNALSDAQEDYSQVEFPTEWMFSSSIDELLQEKFW